MSTASFLEMKRVAEAKVQSMIRHNKPTTTTAGTEEKDGKKDDAEDQFSTSDKQKENLEIKPSSFGMRPIYSRVDINSDKWLMTLDESSRKKLDNPPSLADGLSHEIEAELRYLGCELIQQGAIMLKLPQTAAATGQIIFQRFYYQKSFVKYLFEHTVMACLLLASKIEEEPRRNRDVYNVFHRLERLHRIQQSGARITKESTKSIRTPMIDDTYIKAKNNMILMERRILATLGFVVHVKHPHRLIVAYCHALGLTQSRVDILQKAWNYMNDGLRTDIFMRYTPETIACACIFLAARTVEEPIALPSTPFHWFEAFDTSDRDVQAISLQLLRLYARKRVANWPRINAELDKLRDAIEAEKAAVKEAAEAKKAAVKAKEVADKFGKMTANDDRKENDSRRSSPNRGDRDRKREKERDREKDRKDKIRKRSPGRDRGREYDRRDRDRNNDRRRENNDRSDKSRNDRRKRSRSRSRSRDRLKEYSKARVHNVRKTLGKQRDDSESPPKSRR
ncbi:unnamed protein product [Caenorhabditis angaria]|uniref:Cyclin-like domain-containing protein n=1 Tax=Caenorhabditis angaria TaxID=860376 RepID=A0A9P1ISZ5_9PELO|nr:unnamed protein product [Caenorhabditis angaria]